MLLQQQLYSARITVIDEVTGLSVAEINGCELRIFGRGVTICLSEDDALAQAKAFIAEDVIVDQRKVKISNQVNLF